MVSFDHVHHLLKENNKLFPFLATPCVFLCAYISGVMFVYLYSTDSSLVGPWALPLEF